MGIHSFVAQITKGEAALKKKKSSFLLRLVVIAVAVVAAYNVISLQVGISRLEKEAARLEAQCEQQALSNEELAAQLQNATSDDVIAAIARAKLGFGLPGERVFVNAGN